MVLLVIHGAIDIRGGPPSSFGVASSCLFLLLLNSFSADKYIWHCHSAMAKMTTNQGEKDVYGHQ